MCVRKDFWSIRRFVLRLGMTNRKCGCTEEQMQHKQDARRRQRHTTERAGIVKTH